MPKLRASTDNEFVKIRAEFAKFEELKASVVIDFDGHFGMDGAPGRRSFTLDTTRREQFVMWLRHNIHLSPGHAALGYGLQECGDCGASLKAECDGVTFRIFSENGRCPYPDGMPAYSFEIVIPSGEMVIANDLREFFPEVKHGSVQYHLGQRAASLAYAAVNMGHGCVDNTSPDVFRLSEGVIAIGSPGGEEIDEDVYEHPHEGTRVGQICTDLWWYSIADAAEIRAKGYTRSEYDTLLNVPAGRYRITHSFHTLDPDDRFQAQTYALIEHIAE